MCAKGWSTCKQGVAGWGNRKRSKEVRKGL